MPSDREPPHSVQRTLCGWGNYAPQVCRVFRPEKTRAIQQAIDLAPTQSLISRGLGRSYGDAAIGQGVLSHLRLGRLLEFDRQTGVLRCEAGASLDRIIDFALPAGFFPWVVPGTRFVTVGGAIAADVHGKNHHREGSFAGCVLDFVLVTADGQTRTCSRQENADLFWATLGGMGLTGAIVEARFRLRRIASAYMNVDYRRTANLEQSLDEFARDDQKYLYSVAWIDCLARGASLGRSVLIRGDHVAPSDLPAGLAQRPLAPGAGRAKSVPCFMPGWLLNRRSAQAFNELYYRTHGDRRAIVHQREFFFPLDSVLHWNRIYGRRGFVQYQAVLPLESSRIGLVRLLEQISAARQATFLAVLKTFGEQSQGWLSFPRAGHTLALDLPNTGEPLLALLRKLDAIVLDHGGRVYLAKDPRLGRAEFDRMYPQAERFRALRQRIDPQGRFSSTLAERLGLTPQTKIASRAA